jgi:GNAT superfamily N-acetyltransferase
MAGIDVVAPERLSADERAVVARLYVEAFRRKLRVPLGADPTEFVSSQLRPCRLLLARAAGALVGVAGLRYDGEGFFDPEPHAFRGRYGPLGGVRAAAWRWTVTPVRAEQVLLDALAVRSDVRGTGIGSALLTAVDEHARDRRKSAVILEVVDTNPRAAALYRRHGYVEVHTVRRAAFRLGGFGAATLMLKDLRPGPDS